MIRLEVLDGNNAGRIFESESSVIRIGRAESNDLVLSDLHISAEHASLVRTENGFLLRDLESTNGSRICRGSSVLSALPGTHPEVLVQDGDELHFGDTTHPVRVTVHSNDSTRFLSVRTMSEVAKLEASVEEDRVLLKKLYEAQKKISRPVDLDEVVSAVSVCVFEFLPRATHLTVALRSEDSGGKSEDVEKYLLVGTRARSQEGTESAVRITRAVFRKVITERAAVLATDVKRDVGESASVLAAQIQSAIALPLWQDDQIMGVLQVDNRASSGVFREADLDVVSILGQAASQAFSRARLYQRIRSAEERQRNENDFLKKREQRRRFSGIAGESPAMARVLEQVKRVVDTRATVLIEGETGTGKELVASAVHYWSNRSGKLFVAQNCAALPENLLESELFGHKRGAFTGASEEKKGLFEIADGGTLLLDEVGEMPLSLQAKLLRVLQEGEIRPLGASHVKKVDVRIVAATNRDLEREVQAGRFREDLLYRLRVFPIRLPPLRERREDVSTLACHFLRKYAQEFGRAVVGFTDETIELLKAYRWPGNIRELENEVQRLVIQSDSELIRPEELSPRIGQADGLVEKVRPTGRTLKEMVDEVEKWILVEALQKHQNNKSATAKNLGITREGLHKKLKTFGIG